MVINQAVITIIQEACSGWEYFLKVGVFWWIKINDFCYHNCPKYIKKGIIWSGTSSILDRLIYNSPKVSPWQLPIKPYLIWFWDRIRFVLTHHYNTLFPEENDLTKFSVWEIPGELRKGIRTVWVRRTSFRIPVIWQVFQLSFVQSWFFVSFVSRQKKRRNHNLQNITRRIVKTG